MRRSLAYVTCDVFTTAPFSGNQLAVVFGADGMSTETLQAITREFNYSETVFVFPPEDPQHTRRVRIFTPASEVPFAGHPTIGTAHALVALDHVPANGNDDITVILEEGVGPVAVRVSMRDGEPVRAQLTVARTPEQRSDVPTNAVLASMLSVGEGDIGLAGLQPAAVSCGLPFIVVPLVSVDAVRRARIDLPVWETHLRGAWASEVMVFTTTSRDASVSDPTAHAPSIDGCDVRARVFVPGLSVPEDPATGSANACLAVYLASRDTTTADGVLQWDVAQGIEMGRPSRLSIEASKASGDIVSVRVAGSTVMVCEGTMTVRDV